MQQKKMSFDKLIFIGFGKGWQKTLAAIFKSLGGIISKPTAFFMSSLLKSSNIYSEFVPSCARRRNWRDLIFRSILNTIDARVI